MDFNDNNSSLGKGLGALIPKKDEAGSGNPAQPSALQSANPQPNRSPEPEHAVWAREAGRQEREKVQAAGFGKLTAGKMPEAIFHIEVDKIRPNPSQPRRHFDEESIRELAASIREFGLLQPIVVTKIEKEVPTGTEVEYILISGERRLHAMKLLGLERAPAIIRNVEMDQERLELAVIENLQRENLNPIEMARALARLTDEFRLTQREIASRLGKSREAVANTMRLLDLPEDMRQAIEETKISESHGRLLLTVDDPVLREKLFRDLMERGLTTRELQNRARAGRIKSAPVKTHPVLPPELRMLQDRLSSELGTPVKIEGGPGAGGGKITISFYSEEELKNLIQKLGREEDGG